MRATHLSRNPTDRIDAMPQVLFDVDDDICTISLNRPDKRNAADGAVAAALLAAFERFEADDALRVAVLTGTGGHFCGGADLGAMNDPARRNAFDPVGGGSGPMGPTRMALSKPLIAAVNGYAVAGGLELALLADFRVADEDAVFGVFCRRWGVPLIDGGTVRLPRIVGMGRALDLILTGRSVDATEAFGMGLVNRVTPSGHALVEAQSIARQMARFPQQCMLADRRSAYAQWDLPLAAALVQEGVWGTPMVLEEGERGAARFAAGAGRHGMPAEAPSTRIRRPRCRGSSDRRRRRIRARGRFASGRAADARRAIAGPARGATSSSVLRAVTTTESRRSDGAALLIGVAPGAVVCCAAASVMESAGRSSSAEAIATASVCCLKRGMRGERRESESFIPNP